MTAFQRNVVAIVAGAILSGILGFVVLEQRTVVALDYRAFYCAGMALREHADPYRAPFLGKCERERTDDAYGNRLKNAVLPAPQPLYDIAFFAALAFLPFALSKAVWGAMLGIAIFVTTLSLLRLTGLTIALIFGVLSVSIIGNSLALGQIIPIYTAAACGAALLAKQGRLELAGLVASLSLVEPHLGLPLCVSLAVWSPRSRVPLTFGAATLVSVAVVSGGLPINIEYFTSVLPLHALSELDSDAQLSLSVILHALGLSDSIAVGLATLFYAGMMLFGLFVAKAGSSRFSNRAFLVLVPAAFAIVGGSFVHNTEIVAAVPLALMLVAAGESRGLCVAALILIAVPWSAESNPEAMIPWLLVSAIVAGYVIRECGHASLRYAALLAALIFFVLCETNLAYARVQRAYAQQNHPLVTKIDMRYPQASWATINTQNLATGSAIAWLIRLPTWLGLIVLVGNAAAIGRGRNLSREPT